MAKGEQQGDDKELSPQELHALGRAMAGTEYALDDAAAGARIIQASQRDPERE